MARFVYSEVLKVDLNKQGTPKNVDKDFLKDLSEVDSFEDRVHMIQSQLPCSWLSTPAETLEKYEKNTDVSRALRQRGNKKFQSKNFEDALESYNLAVMFAKTTDEELGLAYANRSAVLVEKRDFEGALEDIELAIDHNYPIALADKLQSRRSKCNNLILKRDQDGIQKKVKAEVEKRKLLKEKMLKIEVNPLMPSAASCVKIKHDDVKGRHLIVNQDVPEATVLIVENPYAAVLLDELDWETKYCHYCLRRIRRGIPCGVCVFVVYCDEACKLKAYQEFHRWECKCLPQLHCNSIKYSMLLAFRMLCKVGPEELARLFMTRDPRFFKQSSSYGIEENCKYESDAYLSIHHLKTNLKHIDALELYNNTLVALQWTEILDTETYFFHKVPGLQVYTSVGPGWPAKMVKEFKNFVAAVMLRNMELIPLNFSVIGELAGLQNVPLSSFYNGELSDHEIFHKIDDSYLDQYAEAIHPVFSMMTHSCDGNTVRLEDVSGGTCIVMTKRRLKAGEVLCISFGMHHLNHSKIYRQSYLREHYYFNCQCIACELDWPQMVHLDFAIRYCCPSCSKKARGDGDCRGGENYRLVGPNWRCSSCGRCYREEHLKAKFNSNLKKLHNIARSLYHNDPCYAMIQLKGVTKYFQYHLCSPNRAEYFAHTGFFYKAVALVLRYAESFY